MSRIVLDTNVIVSALLQPVGPPAQIFELALGDGCGALGRGEGTVGHFSLTG